MFKNVTAILKSANLNSDEEHRTAYCQLYIFPLTRDLAKQISPSMADALFRVAGKMNEYEPRLEMVGSVWEVDEPIQKLDYCAHPDVPLQRGRIDSVEIQHMHIQRKKSDLILVLGIHFIIDWSVSVDFFERLKGTVDLTFSPMGQKKLPLKVEVEKEQTFAEFANARNSKKGKKLVRIREVKAK